MAVATALLFALPALRNSQPGAPPIGCTADVAGFFWNMLITGLACECKWFMAGLLQTAITDGKPNNGRLLAHPQLHCQVPARKASTQDRQSSQAKRRFLQDCCAVVRGD
ncbi:hypothetical protein BC831DRAFT_229063 [Entophlyctis helioformis]|nr:hypothetical protein BC831DRAFT_229063 [Entophlyctis helioformis]